MTTSTESDLEIEVVSEEQSEQKPRCQVAMRNMITGYVIRACDRPASYIVHMHTNANSPTLPHHESSNFMCTECLTNWKLVTDYCMEHDCAVILSYTSL